MLNGSVMDAEEGADVDVDVPEDAEDVALTEAAAKQTIFNLLCSVLPVVLAIHASDWPIDPVRHASR